MTDRELLELAARAAGLPTLRFLDLVCYWDESIKHHQPWNPLKNDGTALRLAVKLSMQLHVEDYGASARIGKNGKWVGCETHIYGGIEAATRRAIVRAAAEVGMGMLTPEEFAKMFPGRFDDAEIGKTL